MQRILDALRAKPELLYELLVEAQDIKVAGPWVVGPHGMQRLTADGELAAEARAYQDGPETVWNGYTLEGQRSDTWLFASGLEAARAADEELLAAGWELVSGVPGAPELMKVTGQRAEVGPWRSTGAVGGGPGAARSARPLVGLPGIWAAEVWQDKVGEGWKWKFRLPWDDQVWDSDVKYRTVQDAQDACDQGLRQHRFLLRERGLQLEPWSSKHPDADVLMTTCLRSDPSKAAAYIKVDLARVPPNIMVDYRPPEGTWDQSNGSWTTMAEGGGVKHFDTEDEAREAATEALRELGYWW